MKTRIWVVAVWVVMTSVLWGQDDSLKELWDLYNKGEYEAVLDVAPGLAAEMPEDAELNLLAGRSLTDVGRHREALVFLERTVKLDGANSWKKAWALNCLGVCSYALGDHETARRNLEACKNLNSAPNATRNADAYLRLFGLHDHFQNWRRIETPHFVFYFAPSSPVADTNRFTTLREQGWEKINGFFNARTPRKVTFFTWNHRNDMQRILGSAGFARPEFCIIHSCFDQTVGHEMTHVITHYAAPPEVKTPLVNEGAAVYFDLSGRDPLAMTREAMRKKGIQSLSVADVWRNWTKYGDDITYPLAGAWTDHLIAKKGKNAFLKLLANQSLQNAEEIYEDLALLMEEFEKKLTAPQSR